MTIARGALMWLLGTTTVATVGVLLVALTGPLTPWIPAAASSAGWLSAVAVSQDRNWAPTAAPAGALNMWALFLLSSQGVTPVVGGLAIAAIAANVLHLVRMHRLRRRATSEG